MKIKKKICILEILSNTCFCRSGHLNFAVLLIEVCQVSFVHVLFIQRNKRKTLRYGYSISANTILSRWVCAS